MHIKFIFFNVFLQADVNKFFKYLAYIFNMFLANFTINENIIEISLNKIIEIFKKNVVHIILIVDRLINKIKK